MKRQNLRQRLGLIIGPALALVILIFFDLVPGHPEVTRTAAVAVLMAVWWVTEAISIPATALLPVALFPLFGIMPGKAVAGTYFNHIIFLFIGGFIMALAMQRWNLHRRIAFGIISRVGVSPRRILLGFMVATAFLSMWISNTATTMMMVPIALAVLAGLKESADSREATRFSIGLLLGVAYAASIGGIATLIGTPPNLAFSRIFTTTFPGAPEITFADWLLFGLPFAVVFLCLAWVLLSAMFISSGGMSAADRSTFENQRRQLGRMSFEEKIILALFGLLTLAWLFRANINIGSFTIPGWSGLLAMPKYIDDGTVAIAIAMILFVIPSKSRAGERLMDWQSAAKLHWGIVILFGGGFALAAGFKESGLSVWIAGQLNGLSGISPVLLVSAVCLVMMFLTELTSNTATTQLALPLLGALAVGIRVNPLLLMIPATISASCAFMLPVATPPNAIVFGSGQVRMTDMIKGGVMLNLTGLVLILLFTFVLGGPVFDINLGQFPGWAVGP